MAGASAESIRRVITWPCGSSRNASTARPASRSARTRPSVAARQWTSSWFRPSAARSAWGPTSSRAASRCAPWTASSRIRPHAETPRGASGEVRPAARGLRTAAVAAGRRGFRFSGSELLAPRGDALHGPTRPTWRGPGAPGQFVIVRPRDDSRADPAHGRRRRRRAASRSSSRRSARRPRLMARHGGGGVAGGRVRAAGRADARRARGQGGGGGWRDRDRAAPGRSRGRFARPATTWWAMLGARTGELLILREEMRRACDRVVVVTDDGSRGERGLRDLGPRAAAGRGPGSTRWSPSGRRR